MQLRMVDSKIKYTHQQLVNIAYKWAKNRHGFVVKEFNSGWGEIPDVLAFTGQFTTLIECKVSRSDFLGDKKKHFRRVPEYGMGNFRIYCCPKGLISVKELPEKWGLLEVNNSKGRLYTDIYKWKNRGNFYFKTTIQMLQAERSILYSIGRRAEIKDYLEDICKPIPTIENDY